MPDTPEPTMAIRLRSLMGGMSVYTFVQLEEEAESRRVEGSQEGGGRCRIGKSCKGQERVIDRDH